MCDACAQALAHLPGAASPGQTMTKPEIPLDVTSDGISLQSRPQVRPAIDRFQAVWRFFSNGFRYWDQTASFVPSSRFLVDAIVQGAALSRARTVVELGAGTGTGVGAGAGAGVPAVWRWTSTPERLTVPPLAVRRKVPSLTLTA